MTNNSIYNLIEIFRKEKEIVNGLTFPFIIGAYLYLNNKKYNSKIIIECLNTFFDSDKKFNIHFCNDIKELVISNLLPEDNIYCSNQNIVLINNNIISTDNSLAEIKDVYELEIKLSNLYNDILTENLFSKMNGKWLKLNKREIELINKITTANNGLAQ